MSTRPRRPPRWPAWLALLAVWSLALLPTLSQALAARTGERGWIEVCTAQGSRWVPLGQPTPSMSGGPAAGAAAAFEHCPWCGTNAPDAALPPPSSAGLAPSPVEPAAVAVRPQPPASPTWPDARPRAPPRVAA